MNQYSTEPEYTLATSEKIHLTEKQLDYSSRNWDQVVVDLEQLLAAFVMQADISRNIQRELVKLVQSLQELV